jgi:uncharacterized protein
MKNFLFLFLFVSFFSFPIAAKPLPISEVQGEKQLSPFDGKPVTVRGIVTARVRNGFFIQTPDGADDNNPKTSEGILIFTGKEPKSEATVGNLVEVTGTVDEFRPRAESFTLPITEIRATRQTDTIEVVSKNNELPKPVVLTSVDVDSRSVDALERFEGMRVKITSLTVSAPTGGRVDEKNATAVSDGTFYGVLSGTPRPFREPGAEIFDAVGQKWAETIPRFDNNPEVLRVDADAQLGAPTIEVTSGATVKNLIGVVNYEYRAWTILPDATGAPAVSGNIQPTAAHAPKEREFTIAAFNIERFFDDADEPATDEPILTREAFQNRLKKASLVVRDYLRTPDVLCLIEVENLATLKKLAERINADAATASLKYEAYLEEGNDIGGIDIGFLVNTARVSVVKVEQIGKAEIFARPSDDKKIPVSDRPALVLQATVKNGDKTFPFTVVGNHLKSLRGVNDPKDGDDVRMKKKLQAEFLARWTNKFQSEKPNEPLILVGDFNAFEFSDGLVDVVGTIKGKPAPANQVVLATEDLVNPDLLNLIDYIPREHRYTYLFSGNAQVLDHFLINEAARKHAARFGFARIGADFPESLRADAARPERLSDHDPAIGYFSLDEIAQAPTPQK